MDKALEEILEYAERLEHEARESKSSCNGTDCSVCTQGSIASRIIRIAQNYGYVRKAHDNRVSQD